MKYPIIDLHCDLLLYLARVLGASIHATADIGATLPYLRAGHVRWQVMAVFARTEAGTSEWGRQQLQAYDQMLNSGHFVNIADEATATQVVYEQAAKGPIGTTLAIENMSAIVEEDEPLELAFQRLDQILEQHQRLFYITMTHHTENRFGGGNYSDVGLKKDGEALLEFMAERSIPVDLSHTSDALAFDILNRIDQHNLSLHVLASHSNYRNLCDHPRNLPKELVQELVRREGLIGANFLRLFVHPDDPAYLLEHIEHGLHHAPEQVAFGADFFWRPGIPAPERQPLFFPIYEDAGAYPAIMAALAKRGAERQRLQQLAAENAMRFWGGV